MLYLKQLRLKNYCRYKEHTFDFVKSDGTPYPFVCFFGPNGANKSMTLNTISLLTANTVGRRVAPLLQKLIRNTDNNPVYNTYSKSKTEMLIEGTYVMDGKEYVIALSQNGWFRNDFAPIPLDQSNIDEVQNSARTGPWEDDHLRHRQRICHIVKADSDLSMNTFQIVRDKKEQFENVASEILRYPVKCVENKSPHVQDAYYCTDFYISKPDGNAHFKSLSAGEKKICKSFSDLLNLIHSLEHPDRKDEIPMIGWPKILTMDNIEMHVYYDRHVRFIDCLKKTFDQQQIFATTHSGVLIPRFKNKEHDKETEMYIDLEPITG